MNIKNDLMWLQCRHGRLHHRSMQSSITLCSTPTYTSIRFCLKSSTSCAFSGRLAAPYFEINELRSGVFSGHKPGSSYKSFVNIIALLDWEQRMMHRMSGQTQLAKKTTTSRIYQKWQRDIAAYITKLLQMPEDTIIQFLSLRQTNCNWC